MPDVFLFNFFPTGCEMKPVDVAINFANMEIEVLDKWEKFGVFQAQNARRINAKEYAFYDGPPFANGLPHYGHLLANTIKDTVTRFWIMKGYKIDRRFGWDCHGLPVEFEIEKRDNLKGRPDILKLGIAKFNETCRESVLHYANEWKKTITRLGRWVDWDNQYRTMDTDYMESVWWVFSQLYKKGLVYQDFKVVPYSPRTSSVVSNFEANQNYKMIQDPSVVIKFKCKNQNAWFLCWTTTPWTLPSNLALAVGAKITYVKIKDEVSGEHWILAKDRVASLYEKVKKPDALDRLYVELESYQASDLVGEEYEPLFPYFSNHENAFKVLEAEFVQTDEGTGIVHQAPAFGEDDFFTCKAHGIKLIDPIDDSGCFTDMVPDYQGLYFKDADKVILKDLKSKGQLVRQDVLMHTYPFDERTDTPLMYKAVPSWYVAVEKFVDKLMVNNTKINWVPSHIKEGRMGSWLSNARDWSISRNRFWGTPLPVWVCEKDNSHILVISSIKELEERSGSKVTDIHLHYTQKLKLSCDQCSQPMKAVDVVFDCWFESGSMPYAQLHYPEENADRFQNIFPADFVAEGLDQTRGWFYTLNVLATALFDKPAFQNVIVNGVILDDSGKKMSKRHRNYTPPETLMETYGADSVRLYLLNSALLRAEDLIFSDKGVKDIARMLLLPLWNAHSFLITYAKADHWNPSKSLLSADLTPKEHKLDRWILSRFEALKFDVESHMQTYKLYLVVPSILEFVEDLTNWYIRLSRRRFWGSDKQETTLSSDQVSAFETLYYVLLEFCKIFSSFAPFTSDKIFENLTDGISEDVSVHLCDLPKACSQFRDVALEKEMGLLRQVVNQGRSLRQKHKIKIRQVLNSMTVITADEQDRQIIEEGEALLLSELNVKKIVFTTDELAHVRIALKPNMQTLGKKIGKKLPELKTYLAEISASGHKVAEIVRELDKNAQISLLGEILTTQDFLTDRSPLDSRVVSTENGVTILLDTELNDELIAEGRARELVNRVQNLRKDSGFHVSDRIQIEIMGHAELVAAFKAHRSYILTETLGESLVLNEPSATSSLSFQEDHEIDELPCRIALEILRH